MIFTESNELPVILQGKTFTDDRGILKTINDFNLEKFNIKRFYIVKNFKSEFIRAWHGHKFAKTFVMCLKGSAIIACTKIIEVNVESLALETKTTKKFTLTAEAEPNVLYIPNGYANGFVNLTDNTELMFFSDLTIEQIKEVNDDIRWNWNILGEEIWETNNFR